jgi:hypothetical protein
MDRARWLLAASIPVLPLIGGFAGQSAHDRIWGVPQFGRSLDSYLDAGTLIMVSVVRYVSDHLGSIALLSGALTIVGAAGSWALVHRTRVPIRTAVSYSAHVLILLALIVTCGALFWQLPLERTAFPGADPFTIYGRLDAGQELAIGASAFLVTVYGLFALAPPLDEGSETDFSRMTLRFSSLAVVAVMALAAPFLVGRYVIPDSALRGDLEIRAEDDACQREIIEEGGLLEVILLSRLGSESDRLMFAYARNYRSDDSFPTRHWSIRWVPSNRVCNFRPASDDATGAPS